MNTLFGMKVFQHVVELQSFISASQKLDISPPMITKYIKSLEEHLEVRLLNRTSRRISLTNEGKIYYDSCVEILNEIDQVESALKCRSVIPQGVLKIAVPSWFYFEKFNDSIKEYSNKYPEVSIELYSSDRIVDLVETGIDLALRVTEQPYSSLIAKRINKVSFFIVGSEEYFKTHKKPQDISDLENHTFIVTNNIKENNYINYIENGETKKVRIKDKYLTNNTMMAANFSNSGLGLTVLPEYIIKEKYFSNLEIVLPNLYLSNKYLFTVYSSRKFLSPKVRTFIDFITLKFK